MHLYVQISMKYVLGISMTNGKIIFILCSGFDQGLKIWTWGKVWEIGSGSHGSSIWLLSQGAASCYGQDWNERRCSYWSILISFFFHWTKYFPDNSHSCYILFVIFRSFVLVQMLKSQESMSRTCACSRKP